MNCLMVSQKSSDDRISSNLRQFLEVLLGGTCEEISRDLFETTQAAEDGTLKNHMQARLSKAQEPFTKSE